MFLYSEISCITLVYQTYLQIVLFYFKDLQIVSMIQATGSKVQKDYQLCKLLVTHQQIEEAVKKYPQLPSEVVQWANSSLI